MKIIIVGGTGFLGYHTALACLEHNHHVASVSLPDIELSDWFPCEIEITYSNVFEMNEDALIELFKGFDAVVYAVGPDDRVLPQAPAYRFFYDRLVKACIRVMRAARLAGVRKAVIAGSYFAYFDRNWPEKAIMQHHPYVKCRIQQAEKTIAAGEESMSVCILELPFIFGAMPERTPLWKDVIVKRLLNNPIVFFPKGGTNMISVQGVAQAFLGAIEYGEHGQRYIIGDVNMTYKDMLKLMMESLGIRKPIVSLPTPVATVAGRIIRYNHKRAGKESGLDPVHAMRFLLSENLFFPADDLTASQHALYFQGTDIKQAIMDTMKACQ